MPTIIVVIVELKVGTTLRAPCPPYILAGAFLMRPMNPPWRRHDAHRFIRHDAHRFFTPLGNERRRAVQAEEERRAQQVDAAEQAAFEQELLQVRRDLADLKFELALRRLRYKYSEDQPRDERGRWVDDPDKGRADDAGKEGLDEAAAGDLADKPVLAAMEGSDRPLYDTVDSALLAPRGINPESSEQKLRYTLEKDARYLGGVTVVNEDRTVIGRLAPMFGRNIVDVRFDARVQTADGISTSSFRIQKDLGPGESITIPWKDFGLMKGPGQVDIAARNVGALYTGVIVGARRMH